MSRVIRKFAAIFAAAAAVLGLVEVGSVGVASVGVASGALIVDVRATGVTGGTVVNPKNVVVNGAGSVVTMGVFAQVTGANGTTADETLTQASGSFQSSTGGLAGNLASQTVAPFNSPSASNGTPADLDDDDDLDVGSTGSGANGKFIAASTVATPVPTGQVQIGTLTFTVTGSTGPQTVVQFVPRPGTNSTVASWSEDGAAKTPGTGTFAAAAQGVTISVPEPGGAAVAVGLLGLIARRRRRRVKR